ncbi:MAG: ferric reductase [Roseobacter sp.]|jgi:predicted ferric reductase
MESQPARSVLAVVIWAGLIGAVAIPLILAASSPLLAWRDPVYEMAGYAGIIGLCIMLFQPLLAAGLLPGMPKHRGRRVHRVMGVSLVAAIIIHVVALWITSPPDVIDVLLFSSPTPFSVWGAIAMWAVFGAALLAAVRRQLRVRWQIWRLFHTGVATVAVVGTVLHVLLIEGTMETISKAMLCLLVLGVLVKTLAGQRVWAISGRRNP